MYTIERADVPLIISVVEYGVCSLKPPDFVDKS
jgi:hypothetical protein